MLVDSCLFDVYVFYVSMLLVLCIVVILFYNLEWCLVINIVFGLIGVIFIMIMVLFIVIVIVCECECGNMELLIVMLFISIELMLGKVVLYVLIGLV